MINRTEWQAMWIAYALESFSGDEMKAMIEALTTLLDSSEIQL